MPLMELENVWKKVSSEYILKNIKLNVKRGEIICIRGKSGVGKTTLSKILSLITVPDRGKVIFLGKDYSRSTDKIRSFTRLKYIGYIPQNFQLLPDFTVYENIELPLVLMGVEKTRRRKIVLDILDKINLQGLEYRYPHEISGGQQQRVAIARALVKNPILIVADEPFSNQDEYNISKIMDLFLLLAREENKSVVILTTDLYADYTCSRDYLLSNSTLVEKNVVR